MPTTKLSFGLPDLECACGSGRTINPAVFAGHELIVLFLPADAEAASRVLRDYSSNCGELVDNDAWLLVFGTAQSGKDEGPAIRVLEDSEDRAWTAFRALADRPEDLARDRGATFYFTRGGNLHRHWSGTGHSPEVLNELRAGPQSLEVDSPGA